ncbi:tRNA-specific adenosine deaminase 2 [Nematocida displodere]|uniref:tRNA-specific adenosine deaminase 2 n=1 Tax=Nematocida displodere TaxID=1805483 RepID=A0A177EAI4_9MICR|nr:tRNA-specific adenosine deaminase 2 [Nematocida displodere]
MDIALAEAEKAFKKEEVPIGCALFHRGVCIDKAHNLTNADKDPLSHAEMLCFQRLGKEYRPSEVEVVVTCEPCIMCMSLLLKLGIKKLTYGCKNPRFGGLTVFNTLKAIQHAPFEITQERPEEGIELLQRFYTLENTRAPPEKRKLKSTREAKILK